MSKQFNIKYCIENVHLNVYIFKKKHSFSYFRYLIALLLSLFIRKYEVTP